MDPIAMVNGGVTNGGQPVGVDVWVVYQTPLDFPEIPFVIRRQVVAEDKLWVDQTAYGFYELEKARLWLAEKGLTRLVRHPDDDPVIVETWI